MQPYFTILVGGVLPFGAVFIEVFFIMSSVWLHHYYYMFGFLLLVVIILIITSAEITIVMTYFQLCTEDHQWWWRSVLTPGMSSLTLSLSLILANVFFFFFFWVFGAQFNVWKKNKNSKITLNNRRISVVFIFIFDCLFLYKIRHYSICFIFVIFWIHGIMCIGILCFNRHCRILCYFLFC